MKKIFTVTVLLLTAVFSLNAEISEQQKNFIKGSIQEKTFIVKQSSGEDAVLLSKAAIDFALSNKEYLGNDRDLNALAVAGILSMPVEYTAGLSEEEKTVVSDKFLSVYTAFEDENVRTAILNKLAVLELPGTKFTEILNDYVGRADPASENPSALKASIKALETLGNDQTFNMLFTDLTDSKWKNYSSELESTITALADKSSAQLLNRIHSGTAEDCRFIFDFIMKNEKKSPTFTAEIAENILARTIYLVEETDSVTSGLISLQIDSFTVLAQLNWNRASATTLVYFSIARQEYEQKVLHEENFIDIIKAMPVVAPMDCVQQLADYLTELNTVMEKKGSVPSENVVLAIISALGAVGDKNAFDPLLGVTYYNYSDTVIAEARSALAKLKW